jgi:hypothetical protein
LLPPCPGDTPFGPWHRGLRPLLECLSGASHGLVCRQRSKRAAAHRYSPSHRCHSRLHMCICMPLWPLATKCLQARRLRVSTRECAWCVGTRRCVAGIGSASATSPDAARQHAGSPPHGHAALLGTAALGSASREMLQGPPPPVLLPRAARRHARVCVCIRMCVMRVCLCAKICLSVRACMRACLHSLCCDVCA